MKKLAVLPVLVILLLTSSCQFITGEALDPKPEPAPAPAPAPTPIPKPGPAQTLVPTPEEKIIAGRVRVKNGEFVEFSGTSILPDRTYLQTQLDVGDELLSWWLTDKLIQVEDGKWIISVPLGENGAPKYLSMSTYYSFKVWEKDNPAVMAGSGFDLMGPPPPPDIYPTHSQFPVELRNRLPGGHPVIMMKIQYTMRGERSYLGIYEDGFVACLEETGLRPSMQKTTIWKAGQIPVEELDSLADFLRSNSFTEMDENYSLSTVPYTDLDLFIMVYYQDIFKAVEAHGYFSPDGGITIPDIPYPLNEIYKRLKDITLNKMEVVSRETIKD